MQDREVGGRQWKEMVQDLPQYLIRNTVEVFSPLPAEVCVVDEVQEAEKEEVQEELCIICMSQLAVCCFCFLSL